MECNQPRTVCISFVIKPLHGAAPSKGTSPISHNNSSIKYSGGYICSASIAHWGTALRWSEVARVAPTSD